MSNRNTGSIGDRQNGVGSTPGPLMCRECMTGGLESFVRAVEAGRGQHTGAALVGYVRDQLKLLVADDRWMCAPHRLPDPSRTGRTEYTVHTLYASAEFSTVACVWRPSQVTPLHDHQAWGAVGILQGCELETAYDLMEDAAGEFLQESGTGRFMPGDVISFMPPEGNIHRVENGGETTAISIHVYGLDIRSTGTSINERFDDTMIRLAQGPAVALPWRRQEAGR